MTDPYGARSGLNGQGETHHERHGKEFWTVDETRWLQASAALGDLKRSYGAVSFLHEETMEMQNMDRHKQMTVGWLPLILFCTALCLTACNQQQTSAPPENYKAAILSWMNDHSLSNLMMVTSLSVDLYTTGGKNIRVARVKVLYSSCQRFRLGDTLVAWMNIDDDLRCYMKCVIQDGFPDRDLVWLMSPDGIEVVRKEPDIFMLDDEEYVWRNSHYVQFLPLPFPCEGLHSGQPELQAVTQAVFEILDERKKRCEQIETGGVADNKTPVP